MDFTAFKNHCLVNGLSQGSTQTFIAKIDMFFTQYAELNQENLNSFFAAKINSWNGSSFNLFINALKHYAKFLKVELEFPKYHKVDKKVKPYLTEKEVNDIIFKTLCTNTTCSHFNEDPGDITVGNFVFS